LLGEGVAVLAGRDPRLASLCDANGVPPLWPRPEGFSTLIKIILEQQVSLDSAAAAYANLEAAIGTIAPKAFLTLDDFQLHEIGFSRQKAGYCRGVARQCRDGALTLDELTDRADSVVRQRLLEIRGVGPWTADVYLLFALRRPDVWPTGDRALVVSMAENLPLAQVPTYAAADEEADLWKPWRSVAARMFWHAYLKRRGRDLD
jgi:DNA-3-methyladenine glycosylase II